MSSPKTRRHGLLIVDHGTRSAEANEPLAHLARQVAAARPEWLVEHAHMELAEPDFATGIDRLVARGAEVILVHLHFLGVGYHVRETIPDLVRAARERHPHLPIETTSPLGEDERIADIVVDRMDAQSARDRQSS
jgi:sirohydrochlorin ferrochelatase